MAPKFFPEAHQLIAQLAAFLLGLGKRFLVYADQVHQPLRRTVKVCGEKPSPLFN